MRDANLPIQYRDSCANLLIPLNRCRYEEYYLPWKCEVSSSFLQLGRFGAGDGMGWEGEATEALAGDQDWGLNEGVTLGRG